MSLLDVYNYVIMSNSLMSGLTSSPSQSEFCDPARNTETRAALREDSVEKRSSCDVKRVEVINNYKPHTIND